MIKKLTSNLVFAAALVTIAWCVGGFVVLISTPDVW